MGRLILFRRMKKQEDGSFKVVGYEKHEGGKIYQSIDGVNWFDIILTLGKDWDEKEDIFGVHKDYFKCDRKDQYTGVDYPDKRKIFERDKVVSIVDGDEYGEHAIVYRDDIDYPAFDLSPPIDCDSNAIQWHTIEGELKFTGIEGVTP